MTFQELLLLRDLSVLRDYYIREEEKFLGYHLDHHHLYHRGLHPN
jgi:hypothetical protein